MSSEILLGVYCLLVLGALIGPALLNSYLKNQNKANRENTIRARQPDWGDDICQALINGEIKVGMTQEMVRLALGSPANIDQQETTQKYQQERWVYGFPRRGSGANYITFRNGEVAKTLVNSPFEISEGGFNPIIVSFVLLIVVAIIIFQTS